jgi:hypothetical protein
VPDPKEEKHVQLHLPPEEPPKMMDLHNHTYQMIKGFRWVPEKQWWDKTKDKWVKPRFKNVLQQTFYYNYKYLPMKLYQHMVINWDHMTLAVGSDVKAYFDDHPGLVDLVSMHHKYVEDWVRVFYATVYIADTREDIMFMFQGHTPFQHHIADKLGLRDFEIGKYDHKTSLHSIVYGDREPPWRSLLGGSFPSDEEMATLFVESFTGRRAYRTPDMLTPEENVIHRALRKTLLPQIGNAESVTNLQQWLLLHFMTGRPFDIVDFILAKIEYVICDGLTVARNMSYTHWISFMLSSVTTVDEDGERVRTGPKDWHPEYMMSETHFKEYRPARPGDRCRGLRATIEPSPDDICPSDSEGNEASLVRHLRIHDASLPTEKTETVPVTPATTSEPMDSSFFLKLILENQGDQRKFQSMMEMRMAQQEELNCAHSEYIAQMVTQHQHTMENFVNASLSHLHQVNGLPPPPALLAPIGQTPLQLMPPANLGGKSFEVYELPHNSAIGSQWMTEKDSKEEKEADATILNVLSDIAAEETNKEDPFTTRSLSLSLSLSLLMTLSLSLRMAACFIFS